ncbi:MAG: prepilin-type N-terminal cleavage/methylation domain-containing protein [Chloroflexi bacterium]|nr:prepilin-type N-terminal cleavage/methylation domain-containing protein [Chloroflexota bacterium]
MRSDKGQQGFTVVEILIVLAVLGILMAVVVPNLTGFLGRGKDRSYQTDQRQLQAAVDAYYTDTKARPGTPKYPTGAGGTSGSAGTTTYINMTHLVSEKYMRDVPQSSSSDNPGGSGGTYSWYVDADGIIRSVPTFISGKYP